MKIASYTLVNNEEEMIESFVRYNANFVDEMHIIDNGCTDGTIDIVRALQKEGYKIFLHDESVRAYEQKFIEDKYFEILKKDETVDLILPLDCDELPITEGGDVRSALEALPMDKITLAYWKWYVLREEDNQDEKNVLLRMKYALHQELVKDTKVIVPRKVALEKNVELVTGHHDVVRNGIEVMLQDKIFIAHYRLISERQYVTKSIGRVIRYIAGLDGNLDTAHVNYQLFKMLESDKSYVYTSSFGMGNMYESKEKRDKLIEYCPANLVHCSNLAVKYDCLMDKGIIKNLYDLAKIMAIQAYLGKRKLLFEHNGIPSCVLVMENADIGWYSSDVADIHRYFEELWKQLKNSLPMDKINIRAIITKNSIAFNGKIGHRLVLEPKFAKFIPFDFAVLIGNCDNTINEMMEYGIEAERIISLKVALERL